MEVRGSGGASRQGAGGRGGGLEATRHRVSQGSGCGPGASTWNMRLRLCVYGFTVFADCSTVPVVGGRGPTTSDGVYAYSAMEKSLAGTFHLSRGVECCVCILQLCTPAVIYTSIRVIFCGLI